MRFSRYFWLVGCIVVMAGSTYLAYFAGINRAVGRGTYVNFMFIREEAKCFHTNDIDCLRVQWRLRAESAAEVARRSIGDIGSSSVEDELHEYIQWVEQLPPLIAGK
jgi:hypothetical protein